MIKDVWIEKNVLIIVSTESFTCSESIHDQSNEWCYKNKWNYFMTFFRFSIYPWYMFHFGQGQMMLCRFVQFGDGESN
jgi:hypothetical protein